MAIWTAYICLTLQVAGPADPLAFRGFPALEGAPSPDGVRVWAGKELDPVYGWEEPEMEWFLTASRDR